MRRDVAGRTPVIAGVSALRTADVLAHAEDAAAAGAAALLLAPMTYQALTEDEVVGLFADASAATDLPIVLYDNPGTTHVAMTPHTYGRIAAEAPVSAVKIPGRTEDDVAATSTRVAAIRSALPEGTSVGIAGGAAAVTGLLAGCDAWFTAIGGTLPRAAVALTWAALGPDPAGHAWARAESARLEPLWALMRAHGSLRVAAAIAADRGWAVAECLARPVRPLPEAARAHAAAVARELGLD